MAQEASAARVAGKTFRTFTTREGKHYLLSQPLRYGSYADEESVVLWKRRDPGLFGLRMYSHIPATERVNLWEGCARADMGGIPTRDEWINYEASTWKTAYMVWQTLDPKHHITTDGQPIDVISGVQWALKFVTSLPRADFDETSQSFPDGTLEQLMIYVSIVSQDAAIKNSSGRTANAEPAQSQPTDDPATPDQSQSTNTSPEPSTEG